MKNSTAKNQEKQASAAITDEDLELDREIERLAREQVTVDLRMPTSEPLRDEPGVTATVVSESTFLGDHAENYKPADNHVSLEQQVFECKSMSLDSIEAADPVFKAIFGKVPLECYAMYKNIKMYRIGMVKEGEARDRVTVEQRLFGRPK